MSIFKRFKNIILEIDMFSASNIISYNRETQYKTMTGAIISLAIIIFMSIGFWTQITSTINKTTIQSTLQIKKFLDPPEIKLTQSNKSFMFGISVKPFHGSKVYDLVNGPQIFELRAFKVENYQGALKSHAQINMTSCTRDHWKIIPSLVDNFQSMGVNKWLCPSLMENFILQGFQSSQKYNRIAMALRPCVNSTSNGNKCASKQIIDQTIKKSSIFRIILNLVNPVINPNQPKHIQYYLQDRNVALASNSLGVQINLEFSDYRIQTDTSFLPYQKIERQAGFIAQQLGHNYHYLLHENETALAKFTISRSPNELIYTRNVMKISQVISYIGGLISAVTIALILVKIYTQFSLHMSIGFDLLADHQENQKKNNQNEKASINQMPKQKLNAKSINFNFFTFCKYYIYKVLKVFKLENGWDLSQKMQRYYEQMRQQLDITILLKRIIKLQSCIGHLLKQNQIEQIKNQKEISYQKARQLRTLLHKINQYDEQFIKSLHQQRRITQKQLMDKVDINNQNDNFKDSALSLKINHPQLLYNQKIINQNIVITQLQDQINNNQVKPNKNSIEISNKSAGILKKKIFKEVHPVIKKTIQQFNIEDIPDANIIQRKK